MVEKKTHSIHCFDLNYGKALKSLKAHGLLIPSYIVMHFWVENVKYVMPCLPQTFIALNILKIEDTFFIKKSSKHSQLSIRLAYT